MTLRQIFCPNCGQATQINDEKAFCFCLECGEKIQFKGQNTRENSVVSDEIQAQSIERKNNDIIEQKLKEVEFYYALSREKKEYENVNNEPVYYLKAQDLLVDLSQQFADDYRIWWELCKPLDFEVALLGVDIYNQYKINEGYFDKALDLATLDEKRLLIEAHDKYVADKKLMVNEIEKKRKDKEAQIEKVRQAEIEKKRIEEEKRYMEIRKAEEERIRREQEERKRMEELRLQGIQQSAILWGNLVAKDYSSVDASYFQFNEGNQIIIGIFRVVSNVLYLMSFRIDTSKNNALYREQSLNIKFGEGGVAMKYDNKPVRINGMLPPFDQVRIVNDGRGGFIVNNMELRKDLNYVNGIMKNAKKAILPYNKIFI